MNFGTMSPKELWDEGRERGDEAKLFHAGVMQFRKTLWEILAGPGAGVEPLELNPDIFSLADQLGWLRQGADPLAFHQRIKRDPAAQRLFLIVIIAKLDRLLAGLRSDAN